MTDFQRRIDRNRLLAELLLPQKIPADHAGTYYRVPVYSDCTMKEPWGLLTVVVRPGSGRSHRLFVKCGCGSEFTAGKYHQHAGACDSAVPVGVLAAWERIAGYRAAGRTWQECQRFHPEPWIVVEVIGQLSGAERDELRRGVVTFEEVCMRAH